MNSSDSDIPSAFPCLDARGLACPLPVLRARKALKLLPPGSRLEVLTTDPGSLKDFPAFCASTGHALEESPAEGTPPPYRFVIRRP